jgi:hypothetical protein
LGIFVLLLLGFGYSTIDYFSSRNYAKVDVRIPPMFLDEKPFVTSTTEFPFEFDFGGAYGEFRRRMRGPLIAPPFDAYITVAQYLTKIAQQNEGFVGFIDQTPYGRQFGNLLNLGSLHFSPYPSKLVDSLIDYLNTTTRTFSSLKVVKHTSEKAAVRSILDNSLTDRAFALIAIRDIKPTKINYVLRMNYSTLPNTNQVVDSTTVGLNINYQAYFTSGFLTVSMAS